MGLLNLFGPSKDAVWSQLAHELDDADFEEGGWFTKSVVRARVGEWTLTLDTYTQSSSTGETHSSTTYTRLRAPYVNRDGFLFTIYREGLFSPLGRLFGMQDIEVGDRFFDDAFVIKGNDEVKVKRLFSDPTLKSLIHAQPRIHFEVREDQGWFAPQYPNGVDELYFRCVGVIKDLKTLHALFEMFACCLDRLCHLGSAYEDDPGVRI